VLVPLPTREEVEFEGLTGLASVLLEGVPVLREMELLAGALGVQGW
jgi:hypothetical protein